MHPCAFPLRPAEERAPLIVSFGGVAVSNGIGLGWLGSEFFYAVISLRLIKYSYGRGEVLEILEKRG